MEIIIGILLWFNILVTPEDLNSADYISQHGREIQRANEIQDEGLYHLDEEGVVIVDEGVSL